jgi:hypothetical protein
MNIHKQDPKDVYTTHPTTINLLPEILDKETGPNIHKQEHKYLYLTYQTIINLLPKTLDKETGPNTN